MEGSWAPSGRWRGLGPGGFVRMTTYSPELPAEVLAEMETAEAAIVAGSLHPFAGPIKDQAGAVKIADGVVPPEDELKGMSWLVEGVQGTLPSAG
jgi:simple sugar transport system substrate-binding protein